MTTAPSPVTVRRDHVVLPTYEPLPPDKNPMFLENRVYQGSSGRVYPLPTYNRISETKTDRAWQAVHIENEFIRVMILPELGGRIHIGQDKTNGYDFFYRQNVIKPALVGLAGPWISGGVEFNWPQHHRPATFMPVEVEVESHPDGSKTVWLGDHDPMERMKGMHGVCLHPGRAVIELKMRAYNRTPFVQTFLWWANVATRVHEGYQSFFPPDVQYVADHARRAISRFPLCDGAYYGVDYAARARDGVPSDERPTQFVPPHCLLHGEDSALPRYAPNDLSWYANIPVPTSYMCLGSSEDFSGGYDFIKDAGLVQVSNHHISPGKKQWTWGNHAFGYAWDRNLTDADGPYIELMLGVYTDNQPDFSFLQPGETKSWSVFWYPIQKIGPVQKANAEAALAFKIEGGVARIGAATTRPRAGASVELWQGGQIRQSWTADLAPDQPFKQTYAVGEGAALSDYRVRLCARDGGELVSYAPAAIQDAGAPETATEPPLPAEVASQDELFVIGQHLAQYRHATRSPLAYWREALRRDPLDARCNNAVGLWHLRRGEFAEGEACFRAAIRRLTSRNPNPYDGEPYYNLGLVLQFQGRLDEAYDAFYKAAWNQAWQGAAFHSLAELDCCRRDWRTALDHLDRSLRLNADNLRARNLRVSVLRALGREDEAERGLGETRALDPLDVWARWLAREVLPRDDALLLDLALDCTRAGFLDEATAILESAPRSPAAGAAPMIDYHLAQLCLRQGRATAAQAALQRASKASPDYCFPARLEDIAVLRGALEQNPNDARAAYYLGNLLYDKRRYEEAIVCWEQSARTDPANSVVWRNLGIAYFNVRQDAKRSAEAYDRALAANPTDVRLVYERDQLWKRVGVAPSARLADLEKFSALVAERDDATVEYCALLLQNGSAARALATLEARRFQPWEGGEGQALGVYVRTRLALARAAAREGNPGAALEHVLAALNTPDNLGEKRHLLANQSDVYLALGDSHAALGEPELARQAWRRAASFRGDFQEMSVKAYSDMTYYSAVALERLGERAAAEQLLQALKRYAEELARAEAKIDYFATSLPTMLLFQDDIQRRQETTALFLKAQAEWGLGEKAAARRDLAEVLRRDPSHPGAADLVAVELCS